MSDGGNDSDLRADAGDNDDDRADVNQEGHSSERGLIRHRRHREESHRGADRDERDESSSSGSDDDEGSMQLSQQTLPLSKTNIPSLCCAFLASITTGGTTYAFGLYGDALKKTLHLSEAQLETISTANFCAGLLSWIPGLMVDRFGTRFGISVGGVLGAAALLFYYAIAAKGMFIDSDEKELIVTALSALGVTIFLSCALVTGSVFKIIVGSCGPGTKGSAVGVAKGYVGLGSGAYACLFQAIRSPGSSDLDFLPMAAFLFIVAASIPSFIVLPSNPKQGVGSGHAAQPSSQLKKDVASPLHFRILYASLITLASIVVGSSLFSLYEEKQSSRQHDGGDDSHRLYARDATEEGDEVEDTQNLPLAALLVIIWVMPIVSLVFVPQASSTVLDDDDVMHHDEEEQGALLDSSERQSSRRSRALVATNGTAESSSAPVSDDPDSAALLPAKKPQHSVSEENLNGDIPLSQPAGPNVGDEDLDEFQYEMAGNENEGQNRNRDGDGEEADEEVPNKNLLQMLTTVAAWLMMWTTTILVGAGTVETNNLGQMVESLHFPKIVTPAALAIFSVAQSAGRVTTGALSESALNWNIHSCCIDNGVPRPFFLAVASVVAFIAHIILSMAKSEMIFVIGTAISGYAFGMVWPLMVLIVGEVFGTAHVAANYMFYDGFTSGAGTFLLSKIVAQYVYESHIDGDNNENQDSEENPCYGEECFGLTHTIISGLSITCIATSLLMMYVTRHSYNRSSLHRH